MGRGVALSCQKAHATNTSIFPSGLKVTPNGFDDRGLLMLKILAPMALNRVQAKTLSIRIDVDVGIAKTRAGNGIRGGQQS